MEIAVVAAGQSPADRTAVERVTAALRERGRAALGAAEARDRLARERPTRARALAPLGAARAEIAAARRHLLLVEPAAAARALDSAIAIYEQQRALAGVDEELADAYVLLGVAQHHAGRLDATRRAFARARALDPDRRLTPSEVHPELARLFTETPPAPAPAAASAAGIGPAAPEDLPATASLPPDELGDLLLVDEVVLVRGAARRTGLVVSAARYDVRAHAFTPAVQEKDAGQAVARLLAEPALLSQVPGLEAPLDPPPAPPPRFWQRSWFWAAVGGAVAAAGGSILAAQAAQSTHTTVVAAQGSFGGSR